MNIVVDKFGRLLLPKTVRSHFGLVAGSKLKLEEMEGKIILKIIDERAPLELSDGVLVFTGKSLGSIEETLSYLRDERLQHFSEEY